MATPIWLKIEAKTSILLPGLSAVVVVEVVFGWPGLGRLALEAVLDRDYPLLQGTVLAMATMLTLVNLGVDLLYFVLDPRIEYA